MKHYTRVRVGQPFDDFVFLWRKYFYWSFFFYLVFCRACTSQQQNILFLTSTSTSIFYFFFLVACNAISTQDRKTDFMAYWYWHSAEYISFQYLMFNFCFKNFSKWRKKLRNVVKVLWDWFFSIVWAICPILLFNVQMGRKQSEPTQKENLFLSIFR